MPPKSEGLRVNDFYFQATCETGTEVRLSHVGKCGVPEPCPSFCPITEELKFCGDDGVTYLRSRVVNNSKLKRFHRLVLLQIWWSLLKI